MPKGGKVTPIDPGVVARAVGAFRGAIKGARDAWFGPGEPLQVLAPEAVRGRTWDYPVAFNLNTIPRGEAGETGISFADLRALSDPTQGGLDLLRIAIEKRKNQMESQKWSIKGRNGSDGGEKARKIEKALRFPDLVHTFSQWQRMLVDDLLVIDAPTIYLAPSLLGYRIPQVMDGALLKRLLREDGRTPLPPEPAFQQILKGVPAVDYSLDEIVQVPRNLRTYRVYGMSPVEQVVMTVSIALRRQLGQLEYYTVGSVPDAIAATPSDWSQTQVAEFQTYWDTVIGGNTAERRRLRFVPGDVKITTLKQDAQKDEWDEWLSRIICWCFDLSPQALVKEMNRATAQTGKETAQEQGLEPLKLWFKDTVDVVLAKGFEADDLELAFQDEEIANPETKANVYATSLGKGGGKPWMAVDEVRAKFGEEPMTPEQKAEITPPPPMPAAAPGDAAAAPGEKATNGAIKKPGALQQPAAEKLTKGKTIKFVRDEKGEIVSATLVD